MVYWALERDRESILVFETTVTRKYAFFFADFKPRCYYWEVVIMLRKLGAVISAVCLVSAGVQSQALCCLAVVVISIIAHIQVPACTSLCVFCAICLIACVSLRLVALQVSHFVSYCMCPNACVFICSMHVSYCMCPNACASMPLHVSQCICLNAFRLGRTTIGWWTVWKHSR